MKHYLPVYVSKGISRTGKLIVAPNRATAMKIADKKGAGLERVIIVNDLGEY